MLKKIFSIKNENSHKVLNILGIKIKLKNKILEMECEIRKIKKNNAILCKELSNVQSILNKTQNVIIYEQLPNEFISKRDNISKEDYNALKMKLYKNLNEEATTNLNKIFDKKDKLYFNNGACLLSEIFDKDELCERNKVLKFLKNIEKRKDYYQWQNYKLPRKFFEPSVIFYGGGAFEIKNKQYVENKTIIDVGCFLADSVLVFNDVFSNTNIISFEPDLYNYKDSLKTLELNNITNTKIINAAISDNSDGAYICHNGNVGNSISNNENIHNIETMTIDDFVKNNNLNVGLIKVDTEGQEQKVLRGAIEVIKSQKPVLLISIYHNFEDFFNIKPMIEEISENGYHFNFVQPILPFNATYEIMLIAEPKFD